jgi:hypothetical protein
MADGRSLENSGAEGRRGSKSVVAAKAATYKAKAGSKREKRREIPRLRSE